MKERAISLSLLILILALSGCLLESEKGNEEDILEGELVDVCKGAQSNSASCIDSDSDGEMDVIDTDDDNDGFDDDIDAFPLDPLEWKDVDRDGTGDNADTDDDGDGWTDIQEKECSSNPEISLDYPLDKDSDGICDPLDPDLAGLLTPHRSFTVSWSANFIPDLLNATQNPELFGKNITTWQMENGGWGSKGIESYMKPWDGEEDKSSFSCLKNSCPVENLSTFDNNATTAEIRFLAYLFEHSESEENRSIFKSSVTLGVDFIINSQYESGGWPQVYPERYSDGTYSNMVAFNDHSMVRVMLLLRDIEDGYGPFSGELVEELSFANISSSLDLAMDYILNSQIIVEGEPTIWCQQHEPETYAPVHGRPYELPGRASWESSGVTALLLNWPDRSQRIENATSGAVQWFHDNVIMNKTYIYLTSGYWENGNITESDGGMMWYRFYNLTDDQFFMAGRDSVKVYHTWDLSVEMKTSYTWGGDWGSEIINETSKMGFKTQN